MDNYVYGDILKYVRESKGISIGELEELSGISKRQIYRIENKEVFTSIYVTSALSIALGVNLGEYLNYYHEFSSFEEYEKYVALRECVESKNRIELEKVIINISKKELEKMVFSKYKQLLLYAFAIHHSFNKDYCSSLKYCYIALDIKENNFNIYDCNKYVTSDISYAVLSLIEYNYFHLKKHDDAEKLSISIIGTIEHFYFNEKLVVENIPKIITRVYIIAVNNLADIYYTLGEYGRSIEQCNKILIFLKKIKIEFLKNRIYFLMFRNHFKLNNKSEYNTYLKQTICITYVENDTQFIEHMGNEINKSFTKEISEYYNTIVNFLNNN
ncbi:MAG: helix-turn-helix domain-containing protein [Lachnospirales bacterium]